MLAFSSATTMNRTAPFRAQKKVSGAASRPGRSCSAVRCSASSSRREFLQQSALLAAVAAVQSSPVSAAEAGTTTSSTSPLCNESCLSALGGRQPVTTNSGLSYHDIQEGDGATPPVGYQVVVHYVAMTSEGKIFANSLEQGKPYDIRVGAGQVIAGLDEGLLSMKSGGIRRLYIPGPLAFPRGLSSAAGRPRVPPNTPVVFDVQLLYVPGLDD